MGWLRAIFLALMVLVLGVMLGFAIKGAEARDAYTAATIECIERETNGKTDEEIDVDAVVLSCMEEAGPLDPPPIPRLPPRASHSNLSDRNIGGTPFG